MNELRWILIGFGIVLLAAIYLWGRRGQHEPAPHDGLVRSRPEPTLHGHEDDVGVSGAPELADPTFDEPIATEPAVALEEAAPLSEEETFKPFEQSGAYTRHEHRGRVEPSFDEPAITEELPAPQPAATAAPTLSSSDSPPPRRTERRKILSVRLAAAPQRFEGAKLLEALQTESLEHGKYDIFHKLHSSGVSVFSLASMVEPGTFDLGQMPEQRFPGVTLFAQLPGPAPGMYALNEMIACARKLQLALGGILQDERGAPLTVHRIERMRQEVRDFERPGHHSLSS